MSGYANRVTTFTFPEFGEPDPETGEPENIHVVIRNPKLVTLDELSPRDMAMGPDGQPLDKSAGKSASYEVLAKLIVGWRVYDATDFKVDEDGTPLPQERLPLPATAELVAKLPSEIFRTITEAVTDAVNPQ